MDLLVLFGTMVIFFAIGVPIGICLIFPCFLLLLVNPVTSASFLAQSFYTGVASSSMIALPFFMICGNIMDKGGISKRLVGAANNCIGGITGSLGMVTILACMMFGAVSGSAVATVAAIGAIMLPEMVRNGYDKYYATGLCATVVWVSSFRRVIRWLFTALPTTNPSVICSSPVLFQQSW